MVDQSMSQELQMRAHKAAVAAQYSIGSTHGEIKVAPPPTIRDQQQELDANMKGLHEHISELSERLAPILRQSDSKAGESLSKQNGITSPVGCHLSVVNSSVMDAIMRLQEIISLIDL